MNLLLLAVALGLAGASPLQADKECQPHSRPWHVRLHGKGVDCSGALINEWWIVTSFDCSAKSFCTIASLGEHDKTVEEGTEQHIYVSHVFRHSPYRSPLHSLTLVRLAKPAHLNQYVQPIPLPTRCPQPEETCSVSGWGSTVANQYEPSPRLKCITVPVVDDKTCMSTFPPYVHWSIGMVCAGQANTDNCLNDRSSVMVCDGHVQGVAWFRLGCENPAHPTVYTKLCQYNDWIKAVMNSLTPTTTQPTTTASSISSTSSTSSTSSISSTSSTSSISSISSIKPQAK